MRRLLGVLSALGLVLGLAAPAWADTPPVPDFVDIYLRMDIIIGQSAACANTVCYRTDCAATSQLRSSLDVLVARLEREVYWLHANLDAIRANQKQLINDNAEHGRQVNWLRYAATVQKALGDTGEIALNLLSVNSYATDFESLYNSIPAAGPSADQLKRLLGLVDLTLESVGAAASGFSAVNGTVGALRDEGGVPVPQSLEDFSTQFQGLLDIAGALKSGAKAFEEYSTAASTWEFIKSNESLASAFGALGQLTGKILIPYAKQAEQDMQDLIDQAQASADAEMLAAQRSYVEEQALNPVLDQAIAALDHAKLAAAAVGNCLRRCSPPPTRVQLPTEPDFVGPDGKPHYGDALRAYLTTIASALADVSAADARYAVSRIASDDPDAPAECKALPPVSEPNPFADEPLPVLDYPPLPDIPSRFCSIQESLDFDANVLEPRLSRAAASSAAASHYSHELNNKIQLVKNQIASVPADYLQRRLDELTQQAAGFDKVFAAASLKQEQYDRLSALYVATPVQECTAPPPLDLSYPHLPDTYCSTDEQAAMKAELDKVADRARKQVVDWVTYAGELDRRSATSLDAALRTTLRQQAPAAHKSADDAARFSSDIQAMLASLDKAAIGDCLDRCLVGSWVTKSVSAFSGFTVTFTSDGTQTVDYGQSEPQKFPNGDEITWRGSGSNVIATSGGVASIKQEKPGTVTMTMKSPALKQSAELKFGTRLGLAGLGGAAGDNKYVCTADTLSYSGSTRADRAANFAITLARRK